MSATEYLISFHASNYTTQFISSQLIFLDLPSSISRIGVVLITFTAGASPKPPPLTGMTAKTSYLVHLFLPLALHSVLITEAGIPYAKHEQDFAALHFHTYAGDIPF